MPLDFNNKLHNAPDWEPYADDPALFKQAFRNSTISFWCIDIFWQAVQRKPEADSIESKLHDLLGSPLSLAEFKEGIRDAKTNSAPGMSSLS